MVQTVIANMMDTDSISHLSEKEQDEYLQNSLRMIQELSDQSTKTAPAEEVEYKCIDLYSLRVLSLLVCRGASRDKANFLAGIVNHEEPGTETDVSCDNPRMQKAVKLLLYCSSILPNKFLRRMQDHEVFINIVCHDPSKIEKRRGARDQRRL